MDGANILFGIILIVFAILQIILFFKIWGMTDDIREIKNKYMSSFDNVESVKPADFTEPDALFKNGMLVVNLKTNQQMRVRENLTNGQYRCLAGGVVVSDFNKDEIMDFQEWRKHL